jgi:hypothetical protein
MNERIEELINKIWAKEYWDHPNTDKLLPAQLNRLAKLIIEECAELAKNKSESIVKKAELYCDDDEELDAAKATAWQFLVLEAEIKKHFGVK